jgi:hypothetical protein
MRTRRSEATSGLPASRPGRSGLTGLILGALDLNKSARHEKHQDDYAHDPPRGRRWDDRVVGGQVRGDPEHDGREDHEGVDHYSPSALIPHECHRHLPTHQRSRKKSRPVDLGGRPIHHMADGLTKGNRTLRK